jgi:hypothetical protein
MTFLRMLLACPLVAACGSDAMPPMGEEGTSGGGESTSGSTDGTDGGVSVDGTSTSSAGESTSGDDTGAHGCADAVLRANPDDPSLPGPWSVGVTTVVIDDLDVEVWYPAVPGSEQGVEPARYDIREQLPKSEQGKITDEENPWQSCDCHRDLPLDDAYGPYPAIVFVHGTASFRTQSLPQMVHWASRGFVVLAADHPGLRLGDMLGMLCGGSPPPQDLDGDVASILAAVRGEAPGLEAFAASLDGGRIGLAGHSAGGNAIGPMGDLAQVVVPLAAGGSSPGALLASTLVMGGTEDSVVAYTQQQSGFSESPSPKRLVGIEGAGHLSFSEICSLENAAGDDLLTIATDNDVCGAQFAGVLFQCSAELLPDVEAWEIVDYATSAAFEETLHCSTIGDAFADITTRFPAVAEFRQE